MPIPKLATVDQLLTAANEAYNDRKVWVKGGSTRVQPVLFMSEADRFISGSRGLPTKADEIAAYRDLAARARSGEVAVTENAASVLNEYGRSIHAKKHISANYEDFGFIRMAKRVVGQAFMTSSPTPIPEALVDRMVPAAVRKAAGKLFRLPLGVPLRSTLAEFGGDVNLYSFPGIGGRNVFAAYGYDDQQRLFTLALFNRKGYILGLGTAGDDSTSWRWNKNPPSVGPGPLPEL